jgi:hypothetical protein
VANQSQASSFGRFLDHGRTFLDKFHADFLALRVLLMRHVNLPLAASQ